MVTLCPIDIVKKIPTQTNIHEIKMSRAEHEFAVNHIVELVQKRAIAPSTRELGNFISPVFLCLKQDLGYHMILNLHKFNAYAAKISFKMETLSHILAQVQKGWYQTKIDITDAFLSVLVKRAHCSYIKFIFNGSIWYYLVLPFGYTGSPRIFTKNLGVVAARLRNYGLAVLFYLDDSWQGGSTYRDLLCTCVTMYSLLQQCGFIPKISKCSLKLAKCIEILGCLIDSDSIKCANSQAEMNHLSMYEEMNHLSMYEERVLTFISSYMDK